MTSGEWRSFYAAEVRIAANVHSPRLIDAFARVPREKFMGPPSWQILTSQMALGAFWGLGSKSYFTTEDPRDLYHDVLVVLDALDLTPGDSVYHLGCGVGYYTAIMAEIVGSTGKVWASEVNAAFADRARENLTMYSWVSVHTGDGTTFDPGVCNAMFTNAGVTHPHLRCLAQLRKGDRIVMPLTAAVGMSNGGAGVFARITRCGDGCAVQVVNFVGIYSCISLRDACLNAALAKALATKALLKLKSIQTEPHEQAHTCIAHSAVMCLSSAEPT